MHEKLKMYLSNVPNSIKTDWGGIAWPPESIPAILELAKKNNWIVLGGDVLTMEGTHTCDNWYFNPAPERPLMVNVKASIESCLQYVLQYVDRNGEEFLFSLTISDAYIGG